MSPWRKHSPGGEGTASGQRPEATEPQAGDDVSPGARFPYATWGPGLAIGGVILAITAGIILSVPAFILGQQTGSVVRFAPPTYSAAREIRSGQDSVAVAVDPRTGTVYTDDGMGVAALSSRGRLLPGTPFGEFEDSEGLAFDDASQRLFISERSGGRIDAYHLAGGYPEFQKSIGKQALPAGQRDGFEPLGMAIAPGGAGQLYVVDRGNESIDRFSLSGRYLGRIANRHFDFNASEDRSAIAVESGTRGGTRRIYVVSRGEGESGHVWVYGSSGTLLAKLSPPGGHDVCGVGVDPAGNVWLADPAGQTRQYTPGTAASTLAPAGRSAPAESKACAVAFDARGRLYAGRAPETLTATANVIVQLATELGFLIVPIGIAVLDGAGSIPEALRRLGVRWFRPAALKWMAAAVGAYLVFSIAYASLIVEPKQKDIAEGFGSLPFQILLISFAAPISEEVCFRGMLFGGLRTRIPRIAAALLSGLIFGALHAITGVSAVPPLIVLGFLFALLYEQTGSIVPGILLHLLNNSLALLAK